MLLNLKQILSVRYGEKMKSNLVIHNGTVFDGTGGDPLHVDVAIKDGLISEIGEIKMRYPEEIDASDMFIAPGFIDIHSHSDYTLLVDPRAVSAIHQGVTLEIVGNCGFGCFPIKNKELAKNAIYGISGELPINWKSASEYFEYMETANPAVNVMSLVPNGQLRLSAVGLKNRPANSKELAFMKYLLEEALDEGACGYSTGLEYATEIGASEYEITSLCDLTSQYGGLYATHARKRDEGSVEAIEEAIHTGEKTGVRLQISHLLPRNGRDAGERCVELVDAANHRGVDIAFDMHTRLYGTTYLYTILPPWALEGGKKDLLEKLHNNETRKRMKTHVSILSAGGDWRRVVLLDNLIWPKYSRRSLYEIAQERCQDPLDTAYDLLIGAIDDIYELMTIIHCYSKDEQMQTFVHPLCVPGSDATDLAPDGPLANSTFHGAYTWASWYYRFMVQEMDALSPQETIYRLTGLPAKIMNLPDRGILKVGNPADIVIFDPRTFTECGTTFEPNLLATGVKHVFVNGVPTLYNGALTGNRGGEVLRRQ